MSVLNFPASPTIGQLYEFNDLTYRFDGVKWITVQTHTTTGEYSLRDVESSLGITKGKLIRWQEGKSIGADEWALYEGDGSVWGSHAGVMVSVPAAPWVKWDAYSQKRVVVSRLAAEAGLTLVGGSFEEGASVSLKSEVVWQQATGKIFGWFQDGVKTVGAGSTPETTGGIGAGAWVDRSDVTLRSELNIVVKVFESVSDMKADASLVVGQKCRTIGYYAVGDGGGNDYEIVAAATGTDDGGSSIDLPGSGLQAKGLFGSIVNVKQFGAVGSGSTADDTAFSNAAKSAPTSKLAGVAKAGVAHPDSCTVVVKAGTYLLSATLDVGNRDVTWVLETGATIIHPQYLNGRVVRIGRQQNMYPSGTSGDVTGLSVRMQETGEDLTDNAEVIGITDASGLSTYVDRDVCAGYFEVKLPSLLATLTGSTTFTTTSVTFTDVLTASQKKKLRVGMVIETTGTRYVGIITGWSSDFLTIYVSAWYLYGSTNAVTPINGLTVILNPFTKGWALNANAHINATSYANYAVCAEFSLINNKGYNVNVWGVDVVNIGTYKVGCLLNLRGGTNKSLYGAQITDVETAINVNGVSSAYMTCVDSNDVQYSVGKNTYTFGKANSASAQTLNFRTSGLKSGAADASISVSGGDASTLATMSISSAALLTSHHYPAADATYNIGYAGAGRFNNAYFVNSPTITSDENYKTATEDGLVSNVDIPSEVLAAWAKVRYCQFKMKSAVKEKGFDAARWHIGVIAQRIIEAFRSEGLDALEYGLVGYDEWEAKDAVYTEPTPEINYPSIDIPAHYDSNGNWIEAYHQDALYIAAQPAIMIQPAIEAGSAYNIRESECLFLEAALQRRRLDALESK